MPEHIKHTATNVDSVQITIDAATINDRNPITGRTALMHLVSCGGHHNCFECAITIPNINFNVQDRDNEATALMYSIREGADCETMRLLEFPHDLSIMDKHKCTALIHAIGNKKLLIVERLLELDNFADPCYCFKVMMFAINSCDNGIRTIVFNKIGLSEGGEANSILLALMANNASIEKIQWALSHGANPEFYWNDYTPLACAIDSDRADVVKSLLNYPIDVNRLIEGKTYIERARGHPQCLRELRRRR